MTDHTRTKGWKRRERNKAARAAGAEMYAKTMLLFGYDVSKPRPMLKADTPFWEAEAIARKAQREEEWRWYKEVLKP